MILLSLLLISCKAQNIKTKEPISTTYCKRSMGTENILIINFVKSDSLLVTLPEFGNLFPKKSRLNTTLNNNPIRITSINKRSDMYPTKPIKELLYVYKDGKVMEIQLTFGHSDSFGHNTFIDSIPFKEGGYRMEYVFPVKSGKTRKNWFYNNLSDNFYRNEQEKKDFSELEFSHIKFSKKNKKINWISIKK